MNPALHAAIRASAKHRQQLLERLKDGKAFSRDTALKKTDLADDQTVLVEYYLKRGIIRSTPDGGIYLVRSAYEAHLGAQRTAGKWALLIIGLSSLIGILLLLANKL